jgi:hypothetical protein
MGQVIKRLAPTDAEAYRSIRLEALEQSPEAFGSTWEESKSRSIEQLSAFLTNDPDRFIFGTYEDEVLVGLVSFHRHSGKKMAHKGEVKQMCEQPQHEVGDSVDFSLKISLAGRVR